VNQFRFSIYGAQFSERRLPEGTYTCCAAVVESMNGTSATAA